jgi:hypothetical protein
LTIFYFFYFLSEQIIQYNKGKNKNEKGIHALSYEHDLGLKWTKSLGVSIIDYGLRLIKWKLLIRTFISFLLCEHIKKIKKKIKPFLFNIS